MGTRRCQVARGRPCPVADSPGRWPRSCVRPSGNVLPQTDLQMPSLELPASCCGYFFPGRPGVHSGSYRVSLLCSPTYPQLSSTEGRSAPHSPGSGHLPQPPLRKPGLGTRGRFPGAPPKRTSTSKLDKELSRTVVPEARALGTSSPGVILEPGQGGEGGRKVPGAGENPGW